MKAIEVTSSTITLTDDTHDYNSNDYLIIKKGKSQELIKINSFDGSTIKLNNSGFVKNLEDYTYSILAEDNKVLSNPIILGKQVNFTGELINNTKIYKLKATQKTNSKKSSDAFYINADESIQSDFVFFGVTANNNLKTLIDLEINNAKNYIFLNLIPFKGTSKVSKMSPVLEKFNLHRKNLYLEVESGANISVIKGYIEYIQNSLSQSVAIIIDSNDWTENELFEFIWLLKKVPKLVLINDSKSNIAEFCSVVL
jgi:hypothetical protein